MVQRESAQKEKAARAASVLARGYRRLGVAPSSATEHLCRRCGHLVESNWRNRVDLISEAIRSTREGIMDRHVIKALLIPIAMATVVLPGAGFHSNGLAADPEMKIEVTMKDKEYHVKGHTMPGTLTAIVLKNNDTVTHGFSSSLFKDVQIRKEGDAVEVKGKGVRSFHVDPGKSATLYFTKGHSAERETMQYPFWCDIHSNMKGEFLIVETTGEVGGG